MDNSTRLMNLALSVLGCTKHTSVRLKMVQITEETLLHSGIIGKLHLQVCCATVGIVRKNAQQKHLYFNMYYII